MRKATTGRRRRRKRLERRFSGAASPAFPLRICRAPLWSPPGNGLLTAQWARACAQGIDQALQSLHLVDPLTLAWVQVAQGQPDASLELLASFAPQTSAPSIERDSEMLALHAFALQAQGTPLQPERALAAAFLPSEMVAPSQPGALPLALPEPRPTIQDQHAHFSMEDASWPVQEALSQREQEIIALLATGRSNQEIADLLIVAPSTIKWHLKHLYNKLGVHNRTQAVARARAWHLLP